jgi:putative SOS response-associated peptidase YedK
MCAFYDLKIKSTDLEKIFGFKISPQFVLDSQVFPGYKSFILIHSEGEKDQEREVLAKESVYSLSPSWAAKKTKFATYNARVETIFTKPTWIDPIRFKRCLVPLNAFYESIYEKEYAGNVVRFSRTDHIPLIAAGIWDSWTNPKTKEASNGFAIITRPPLKFIDDSGHDRSPIILHPEYFHDWLNPKINGDEKKILSILESQKDDISFRAEIVRELKGYNKDQLKLF